MRTTHHTLAPLFIFCSGILIACISFAPSLTHLFRSDQWYIAYFSFSNPFTYTTLGQLLRFELFGDARFQPFAYPLLFLIHKTFGTSIPLYHVLSLAIHICNGFMIFRLLSCTLRNNYLAAWAASVFLAMFLHADTVAWTHFIYVSFQLLCILMAFYVYIAGIHKDNPRYLYIALPYLIVALFLYESIFFTALVVIPLFFFLAKTDMKTNAGWKIHTAVVTLSIWLVFLAAAFLYKGSFDSLSRFAVSPNFAREKLVLKIFFMMLQNCVNTLTAIPNSYFIADIPYLSFRKPSPLSIFLILLFIGYFFFSLFKYIKKRENLFPVILYCSMASYIFTIAVSRGTFYSVTQSRYFYYADAMYVMIAACAAYDLFGAVKKNGAAARVFISAAILWTSIFLVNNAVQIHRFCASISDILYPQEKTYRDIESARTRGLISPHDKKVFLYSTISPGRSALFLGSQIFPATMFFGSELFTRNARNAMYTYSPDEGFRANPLFEKTEPGSHDFTMEFDLEYLMLLKFEKITLMSLPSLTITIQMERNAPSLIIEGRDPSTGKITLGPVATAISPDLVLNHFVIQNERSQLCVLQNRRVILCKNIGSDYLHIGDDEIFSGVTGRKRNEAGFSLENFYVCLGLAKYTLGNCKENTKFRDPRLGYQVFGLSSIPAYYLESFMYDKKMSDLVRGMRAAIAAVR